MKLKLSTIILTFLMIAVVNADDFSLTPRSPKRCSRDHSVGVAKTYMVEYSAKIGFFTYLGDCYPQIEPNFRPRRFLSPRVWISEKRVFGSEVPTYNEQVVTVPNGDFDIFYWEISRDDLGYGKWKLEIELDKGLVHHYLLSYDEHKKSFALSEIDNGK